MNLSIVEKTGLKMLDLAEIVGVTRGRVSQWKNSPPKEKTPTYHRLVTAIDILEKAYAGGKLPLETMDRAARTRVISKIKAKLDA